MAVYLKDLIANPDLLNQLRSHDPKCCACGVVLQETITGKRTTPDGEACSDCYYEGISKLVERHPIVSAGSRRG